MAKLNKRALPLAISLLIALGVLVYTFWVWQDIAVMATPEYRETLGVLVILMYAWALFAWLASGHRFVCVYVFFLLYAFTSNAGQTLIHLLDPNGVYSFTDVYADVGTKVICQMLLFQLLCIAFMNVGALLGAKNGLKPVKKEKPSLLEKEKPLSTWPHLLFLGTSAFMLVDALTYVVLRRSMSYAEMYGTAESMTNTYILFAFAATSIYVLYNVKGTHFKWYLLGYVAIAVLYFIAGTRTKSIPLIFTLLLVLYARMPQLFAKKYLWIYIPLAVLFFAISAATSFVRTSAMGSMTYGEVLQQGVFHLMKQSVYEMGMSAKTICTTIAAFNRGIVEHEQTILYYIVLAVIPRPLLNAVGVTAPAIGSLAAFATGDSVSGAGYSFIAEFYFDFGLYAFIPILLYGYLITAVERRADDSTKKGWFLFACVAYAVLCKQTFFARATFDLIYNYLRNSFYVFILWVLFSGALKSGKLKVRCLYTKKTQPLKSRDE